MTFSLFNVAITSSAPPLSMKTISAITVGDDVMTRQECISPPTGIIADSISADVVPGAKLLPTTVYGPASPRILIPMPASWTFLLVFTPLICLPVVTWLLALVFLRFWLFEDSLDVREPRDGCGLWSLWRSCPHAASMFDFTLGAFDLERCDTCNGCQLLVISAARGQVHTGFVTPTLLARLGPVPGLGLPFAFCVLVLRPLPKISFASASFFLRRRSC